MSIKAMQWAWERRLQPSAKVLLLALADIADDRGYCWPSNKTLARKCCTSERTVQRMLKHFRDVGLLEVESRFTQVGRQTSNGYQLALGCAPDNLSSSPSLRHGEGDKDVTPGATKPCHPGDDTSLSSPEPLHELDKEPPPQQQLRVPIRSLEIPLSMNQEERAAIGQLLAGAPQTSAQALLDELAFAIERRRIKGSPVAWFAGLLRKANEGRFSPIGAHVIGARRGTHSPADRKAHGAALPSDPNTARGHIATIQKLFSPKP